MELLSDKVVADTVEAAVGRGNAPHHRGEVVHDTEQETGNSNSLHDERGKQPKAGWQKTDQKYDQICINNVYSFLDGFLLL